MLMVTSDKGYTEKVFWAPFLRQEQCCVQAIGTRVIVEAC